MRVLFRADASTTLGSGHVMRCLALADELSREGAEVEFICREATGDLIGLISGTKGYAVHRLPEASSFDEDATLSVAAARAGARPAWLVVDHYRLDREWERQLRPFADRLMVMDDLADRPHDCDVILDQNLNPDEARYDQLVPQGCLKLLGPRYALLRSEFAAVRANMRARSGTVERVLISFGGSDPTNETTKALDALDIINPGSNLIVDVVVGENHHAIESLTARIDHRPHTHLHVQPSNMAVLMLAADLALGAGGSTCWERCCMGLPSLVITTAPNQEPVAHALAHAGASTYLGNSNNVSAAQLSSALSFALDLPHLLHAQSQQAAQLVDGLGSKRVARTMLNTSRVTVRPARADDCRRVYNWRNHATVREASLDSAPIAFEQHAAWYERVRQDPNRHLLVGESDGVPVGVVRFDLEREKGAAEVSIYLAPERQGQGLGPALLRAGEFWLKEHEPRILSIDAQVMATNRASQHLFSMLGYHLRVVTYRKHP